MQWNRVLVVAGILAIGTLLIAVLWFRHQPQEKADLGEDVVDDPRLSYETPFRNVRPGVKYLGDQACADCHSKQDQPYHQHPMGLSIVPIAATAARMRYDSAVRNPFVSLGVRYQVDRQGDRIFHEEIHPDAQGQTITENRREISYAIGSGARAMSFLTMSGEYLFQAPITWYSEKQRWDLSPGYERVEDRFERPVQPECLFCHCNPVEAVKDTLNHYQMPLFPYGAAIGCERCHGPGELHVRERRDGIAVPEGVDHSIVNPRHLEPPLREAICQQCHLEAERRILRRGRQVFDFRPGLPLHLFWSDFLSAPDLDEKGKFVGKVEQMYASRCFARSKGKMGCATCHDPHELPNPRTKTAYYRQRCMDCHRKKGCSLPLAERIALQDNCVECHMPKLNSADIVHTAFVDHQILRRPLRAPVRPAFRQLKPGETPLVHFHKDLVDPDDPEVSRDMGLALIEMARFPTPLAGQLGDTALPYLEAALSRGPRDAEALRGQAFVLGQHGRHREALELVQKVLARSPNHETALEDAANYADREGERALALKYSRQLIAVNPFLTRYRVLHVRILTVNRDFDAAIRECREVLQFNPASVQVRSLLVSCYLQSGDSAKAREEFAIIVKLNPPNKDELIRWFEAQLR